MNREKEIFEELFVRYPALEGIREDMWQPQGTADDEKRL